MGLSKRSAQIWLLLMVLSCVAVELLRPLRPWPLIRFEMFSKPLVKRNLYLPYGVDRDGREFSISQDRYLAPFRHFTMSLMLERIVASDRSLGRLRTAASAILSRYQELKKSQSGGGWPEIEKVRIYRAVDYNFEENYEDRQVLERVLEVSAQ